MADDAAAFNRDTPGTKSGGGPNESPNGAQELTGQAKDAVTGTVQETVDTVKSAGTEIAGTVQEQVSQVVEQAVTQSADTIAEVKEQASSLFVDQRDRAIAGLSGLADALRETGRTLSQQADGADGAQAATSAMAPFVEEIADRLSQSSDFLKEKDVQQLIGEAEQLARKQPMLFVGALFGVGVIGARLLKGTLGSSDDQSPQAEQDDQATGWNAGTGRSTPDRSTSQTPSDATTFSSQVATGWADRGNAGAYESDLSSDRGSVYSSGAANTTGTSS